MTGRGYDAEDGDILVILVFRLVRWKQEKEKQDAVTSKFFHLSLASVRFGC
jgi:hypothetical protein